jgi:hypothetical protein
MEPDGLSDFSENRLRGEPVPEDTRILLQHRRELLELLGVDMQSEASWAPWLDTSYLSGADLADPDIVANVKAVHDVCGWISFVAAYEEGEYYGYWRGPESRPVARSPIVLLDNEGQFQLCAGRTLAEALVARAPGFEEARDWMRSIGIGVPWDSEADMSWFEDEHDPDQMHREAYDRRRREGGAAGS